MDWYIISVVVFVCSELRANNMLGFCSLQFCRGLVGLWSCMFFDVFHMCWPRVWSTVVWMDGLALCFGCRWVRVAGEQDVGALLLRTWLWLGWVVAMNGFVYVCFMWPWVGSRVVWMDGLILCLGVLLGQSCR